MQIQKHKSQKSNGKQYYKYVMVIPLELMNKLKWKAGEKLEATARYGKLILKRVR